MLVSLNEPVPIRVEHEDSNDILGTRLVYRLKEEIRHSGFATIDESSPIHVVVKTMDLMPTIPGQKSMFSVNWIIDTETCKQQLIYNTIGHFGISTTNQMVESLAAETDKFL